MHFYVSHRPALRLRGVPALRTPFGRVLAPSALRAFTFSQAFALQKMPEMTYTPSFLIKASFFRYFVNALDVPTGLPVGTLRIDKLAAWPTNLSRFLS